MKKVWLVERSRGGYEDYMTWNDSIWGSFDEAEKRALELVSYDPQKELDELEIIAQDEYGNNLTIVDILLGDAQAGSKWAEKSPTIVHKVVNGKAFFPVIPEETYIPLEKNSHLAVNKEFLDDYGVTIEDVDNYITLEHNSWEDEWDPTIIEMPVGVADCNYVIYRFDEEENKYKQR